MGQDWGGRRKINPENAPKVTRKDVLNYAAQHDFHVFRGGFFADGSIYEEAHATWWVMDHGYITLGDTNYVALEMLKSMVRERMNATK